MMMYLKFYLQVIKAYSAITLWDANVLNSLYYNKYHEYKKNIIVIITIKSLSLTRSDNIVDDEKLLGVDEEHNFVDKIDDDKYKNDYMFGLSATPVFGKDKSKIEKLVNFFGGEVYTLPIEDAIGEYLVNYEYHPLFAEYSRNEEGSFNSLIRKMAGCFKDGILVDKDTFLKAHMARLGCISMIQDKIAYRATKINCIHKKQPFLVAFLKKRYII